MDPNPYLGDEQEMHGDNKLRVSFPRFKPPISANFTILRGPSRASYGLDSLFPPVLLIYQAGYQAPVYGFTVSNEWHQK